ncbi:MAG: hypothetical protein GY847_11685 [Proteobacteria bacterium]|nr:hypothetical protein [Pseudomonadota bacterium]
MNSAYCMKSAILLSTVSVCLLVACKGGDKKSMDDRRIHFSYPGGIFIEPFLLEIETSVSGAKIYYTTDHSIPSDTAGAGQLYQEPIEIEKTTWVRARLFLDDETWDVLESVVYLRASSELAEFDSNLPLVVIDSFGVDIDLAADPERPRPFRLVSAVIVDLEDTGRARLLGSPDFIGHAGMHVRGNSSSSYEKNSMRLRFGTKAKMPATYGF